MHYVNVMLPTKLDKALTYKLDAPAQPGALLSITWHKKTVCGIVMETIAHPPPQIKLKHAACLNTPALSKKLILFIQRMASYTLIPQGHVWRMVLGGMTPDHIEKEAPIQQSNTTPHAIHLNTLNPDQHAAHTTIMTTPPGQHRTFLLHGVTGSGKTEVYFHTLHAIWNQGRHILILLPEIGLSHQWLKRFEAQFGFKPYTWHSHMTPKERRTTWHAAQHDAPCIVVGTRSALFLPFHNLGLIIVDEEHDPSYKQDTQNIYHGRDMAVLRAAIESIPIILASATPSLESYQHALTGKYTYIYLKARFQNAQLPTVHLIDRRIHKRAPSSFTPESKTPPSTTDKASWLTLPLYHALKDRLTRREQSLLFLNRRGYAPITLCTACGHIASCPDCSTHLVQHRKSTKNTQRHDQLSLFSPSPQNAPEHIWLQCHYCGFSSNFHDICHQCHATDTHIACGPGVDRVVRDLGVLFPQASILTMTRDLSAREQKIQWEMLCHTADTPHTQPDIIVGTQLITKGHHMPNITLVGIVDGDMSIQGTDLRASERTFQILHQVSGRAGRAHKPGDVFVQTYQPEHPLFQALQHHDLEAFLKRELETRQNLGLPPWTRLITIVLSALNLTTLEDTAHTLAQHLRTSIHTDHIDILGPTPALLFRLQKRYRYRIMIRSHKSINSTQWLRTLLPTIKISSAVRVHIDVDPLDLV